MCPIQVIWDLVLDHHETSEDHEHQKTYHTYGDNGVSIRTKPARRKNHMPMGKFDKNSTISNMTNSFASDANPHDQYTIEP
ncbi:unnamed protein product [Phytophthora lilii]|uniref:Unnamed protein product n=1 Tax=Phytophthora lilii TaxID=2077276 RepID=A0A9W6X4E8_9STRA|nr:unnamed protein product [Phytophthora lilii]